jgi:uncharacterized repeat protein (TIGR02543 family)
VISGIRDDYKITTWYERKVVTISSTPELEGNATLGSSFGRVLPDTTSISYDFGQPLSLEAIPETGYEFVEWKVSPQDLNYTATDVNGTYQLSFPALTKDATAKAKFRARELTVTVLGTGDTLLISTVLNQDSLPGPFLLGQTVDVGGISALPGFIFRSDDANFSVSDSLGRPVAFIPTTMGGKIILPDDVVVRVNTSPDLLDGDKDGLSNYDESITYRTRSDNNDTDSDGLLDGWEIKYGYDPNISDSDSNDTDGDSLSTLEEASLGTNPRDKDTDGDGFTDFYEANVTGWDPTRAKYLVTLSTQLPQGVVGASGSIGGITDENGITRFDFNASEGEMVHLLATAGQNYDFTFWDGDAKALDLINALTGDANSTFTTLNPLSFPVHSDVSLVANFVPKGSYFPINLSLAQHPDGVVGSVIGSGLFPADFNATLTASPKQGYDFIGWVGDLNSTSNPLSFIVTKPLNLTAHFLLAGKSYSISGGATEINGSKPGSIIGLGFSLLNETRTLTAVENPGYVFDSWSADLSPNDPNPVQVKVTKNLGVGANFLQDTSDSDSDGLSNYEEFVIWETNASNPDTDGDGLNDKYELDNGLDPTRSDLSIINLIKDEPDAFGLRFHDPGELSRARQQAAYEANAAAIKIWSDFNATKSQNGFSFIHTNEGNDLYRFIAGPSVPNQTGLGWFYTEQHGWAWLQPSIPGWIYLHKSQSIPSPNGAETLNWLNLSPPADYFNDLKVISPSYPFKSDQFFWLTSAVTTNGTNYPPYSTNYSSTPSQSGNDANGGSTSQSAGTNGKTNSSDSGTSDAAEVDDFGNFFKN